MTFINKYSVHDFSILESISLAWNAKSEAKNIEFMDINMLFDLDNAPAIKSVKLVKGIFENLSFYQSFSDRVINFLTLKTFKIYMLSIASTPIISAINKLYTKIQNKKNDRALELESLKQQDLQKQQELQRQKEVERQLELKKQLEESARQEEFKKAELLRQKQEMRAESVQKFTNPEANVKFKLQMVTDALAYVESHPRSDKLIKTWTPEFNNTPDSYEIDQQIKLYLQEQQQKLSAGENVSLPFWFHATKTEDNIKTIVTHQEINMGIACASSKEEEDYGPFSVAFDHFNTWKNGETVFFSIKGLYSEERMNTTWIHGGNRALPTREDNIAFLVTANKVEDLETLINATKKKIKVVSRDFSKRLYQIFNQVEAAQLEPETQYNKFNRKPMRIVPNHWVNCWAGWEKAE